MVAGLKGCRWLASNLKTPFTTRIRTQARQYVSSELFDLDTVHGAGPSVDKVFKNVNVTTDRTLCPTLIYGIFP